MRCLNPASQSAATSSAPYIKMAIALLPAPAQRPSNVMSASRRFLVRTVMRFDVGPLVQLRIEHHVATERADAWRLYRVHLFAQEPRIFTIASPLDVALQLRTELWRASFA